MKDQELWNRVEVFDFAVNHQGKTLVDRLGDRLGWSEAQIARAIHEYRRFLYLYGMTKTTKRAVGGDLDHVWQVHMADSAAYQADCTALFGRALPYFDHFTAQDQERTAKAYRREFGIPAPSEYWPDPNAKIFRIAAVVLALAGLALTAASGSIWPVIAGLFIATILLVLPQSGDTSDIGDHAVTGWDSGGGD